MGSPVLESPTGHRVQRIENGSILGQCRVIFANLAVLFLVENLTAA